MICISILRFGQIANKFNILSILKEVIIFPEKCDLSFRIGQTNWNTLRPKYDFSFVEFPYEGKKLAEEMMLKRDAEEEVDNDLPSYGNSKKS